LKKIDIIIVNWNSGNKLHECITSIGNIGKNGFELDKVVVVDNASTDNSLQLIEKNEITLLLHLIRNTSNRGFAVACNQGAEICTSDYLLFLNPDTVLFKDSLIKPIYFMENEKNKRIGIVTIQLVNEKGEISCTCTHFPTLKHFVIKIFGLNSLFPNLFKTHFMTEWDHREDRIVDHVIGAFYLVRRELFVKLEGFDERFFVYLEDLDFSYRMSNLGYYSYYLNSVQAYHKGGAFSEKYKDIRLFYSLRSRIIYGYKHFNWFSATILALCTLAIEPITRTIFAIMNRSFLDVLEMLKAYIMLLASIPKILFNRNKIK